MQYVVTVQIQQGRSTIGGSKLENVFNVSLTAGSELEAFEKVFTVLESIRPQPIDTGVNAEA